MQKTRPFSNDLQQKIDTLKARRQAIQLGSIPFSSPLLLAPMSAICNAPFRLLMEELGAGGTVSELISCHGINYGNVKTRHMLTIHEREENIGIQLFGEDPDAMAESAKVAQDYGPKFIDINMGCPVRKVVSKGGGSALLKDTRKLGHYFQTIKNQIQIPLTVKIRTGWDQDNINAPEVIHIAKEEGLEFIAIHGRTRTQQYLGQADWQLLEKMAATSPLPFIGNGDLHTAQMVRDRLKSTQCQALMLGRGPLRNPFLFLDAFHEDSHSWFGPKDYLEIINRLADYIEDYSNHPRALQVQMRKLIVWFAAGFSRVAKFRGEIFATKTFDETIHVTTQYFLELEAEGLHAKKIDNERPFMMGGHG